MMLAIKGLRAPLDSNEVRSVNTVSTPLNDHM